MSEHENSREVLMDPSRVCRAISKIGYSAVAAVKDIIDNSIAAEATSVTINLTLKDDTFRHNRNSISKFEIVDNGCGMDNEGIFTAFQLGSNVTYHKDSLSKYGMGMKSAGLSLGNRISVISKTNGNLTDHHHIDLDRIDETKKYNVYSRPLSAEEISYYNEIIDGEHGTVVSIDKCNFSDQASLKSVVDGLSEELGVVYYKQLTAPDSQLSIRLKEIGTSRKEEIIDGFDILFKSIAKQEFDPDNYDCTHPCKVIDTEIAIPGTEDKATLEAVIFPQAGMATAQIPQEHKELIRTYKVGRRNMGFFIYRNGRLIRWGDRIFTPFGPKEALVGKDEYGFRARLCLTSAHDDVLHVDVSKQKINLPEDVEQILRSEIVQAIKDAQHAFTLCKDKKEETGRTEGDNFNIVNQSLEEELPSGELSEEQSEISKERGLNLAAESESSKEEDEPDVVEGDRAFRRIRYSSKVLDAALYSAGFSPSEGTFVRINKNTAFYEYVLKKLNNKDNFRQVVEGLLWALAVSDNQLYKNLFDIEEETLTALLRKKNKFLSHNISNWIDDNPDIIDG
ncbi:ATP-binding protein [Maridesulfovibrio sp.]|uniref:ATP-binding protein n=1 Tax=Maridesulfovibrio sp. TaxID=2795000 RepID=UPI002A1891C5|nr:ATP-binding protein [Maridesulfovibrio sp.]